MRSMLFLSIVRGCGCVVQGPFRISKTSLHHGTLTETKQRHHRLLRILLFVTNSVSLPGSLPEIPQTDRDHVNNICQTEVLLPGQFSLLVSALGDCEVAMVRSAPLPSVGGERN